MYKKSIWLIGFILLFILFGCSSNASSDQKDTEIKQETEEVDTEVESTESPEPAEEEDKEEPVETNTEDQSDSNAVEETVTAEPLYKINDKWNLQPIKDGVNEKVVLLTIDDGPKEYALEMAKTLKELNAPAIFFVNGHFLEIDEKQKILKQIHEMGFAIGNHTYNHQNLTNVDEATQKEEILSLSTLIEKITGEKPKFFRAPQGENTDFATKLVKEEGMLLMNWTYGYDYFEPYMDAEKLTEAMITGEGPEVGVPYSLLNPGANLLMHDRPWTAEALADIVTGLREKGYEMADPDTIKIP